MRPRALAAAFGTYHALIFILAWFTAKDLPGAWYNEETSRWVYFGYLLAAGALLAGLAGAMVARMNFLDRRLMELDERAEAVLYGPPPDLGEAAAGPAQPKDRVDRDIDDLLESLSEMEATTVVEAQMEEAGVETAAPPVVAPAEIAAARAHLERLRAAVRAYLGGPAAIATFFLGISGAMLPGTGGFLQTFHQLNTTLILGMGYGWIGLGAYVVAAVAGLLKAVPA